MNIILLIIIGLAGGIIGGMGMGGGTLLIPLLTIFGHLDQHIAQAVNLLAFIPMSVIVLLIHIKNKLVDFKVFWWIALPATVFSVLGSLIAKNISGSSLSRYFGIFLIVLAVYQLAALIIGCVKECREKNKPVVIPISEL